MTETLTPAPPAKPAAARVSLAGRSRLVQAEIRKVTSTNTWWLFGLFVLVATGLALLVNVSQTNSELDNAALRAEIGAPVLDGATPAEQQAYLDDYNQQTNVAEILARGAANIFTSGQFFGLMLVMIVGALIVTNEFAHQTATPTFLTTPQRVRVVGAKFAAAAVVAAGYWLVSAAFSIGIGSLNFATRGYDVPLGDPQVLRAIGMNLFAYVLMAVFGLGLGVLIRSQIGASLTTTGLYLLSYPAGLLIFGFIYSYVWHNEHVTQAMVLIPGIAADVMVHTDYSTGIFSGLLADMDWWVGTLVLLGYAVVAGVVGTVITARRDIS